MQVFIPLLLVIVMLFLFGKVQLKYKAKTYTKDTIALGISFGLLFLIAALRYDVGYDYIIYHTYYYFPKGAHYFEIVTHWIYDMARFFNTPWVFFATYALLISYFVYSSIKKYSADYFISVIIYMSLFYLNSLSIVRQALSIAIVFWGFRFVKEKRLLQYILVIGVAMMAHSSALVAIPIYFIFNYVELKYALIGVTVVATLGMRIVEWMIYNVSVFNRFQVYISRARTGGNAIRYVYILLFLVMLALYWKIKNDKEELGRYLSLFAISMLFPFVLGTENGLRVGEYYNILYLFFIPLIMKHVNIQQKRLIFALPFCCYFILFLIIDSMNLGGYTPYFLYFLADKM